MQPTLFQGVAAWLHGGGSYFPLCLGRQPRAGPARVGVGFEKVDMAYGNIVDDGLQPMERKFAPLASLPAPVHRRLDLVGIYPVPSFGQPELGPGVAAVRHESEVLAIGHETTRQRKRIEVLAMPRRFVVECKA